MKRQSKLWLLIGCTITGLLILIGTGYILAREILLPQEYRKMVTVAAQKQKLDPLLVAAVVFVESHFDPQACSHKDAKGLMQLMPGTALEMAAELELTDFKLEMLTDSEINLALGCAYLKQLLEQFDDDVVLALAAYNGGHANVRKWLLEAEKRTIIGSHNIIMEFGFAETADYVQDVIDILKLLRFFF